ncbi:hypothetical protein [Bacillus paramycoides]|uniref:hypothetical protein n=1 Tax=Bacillus paramycoides TaxID=2026194 RepID=UPI003D19CF30
MKRTGEDVIGLIGTLLGFFGFIKAKGACTEAGFLMIVSAIGLFVCVNQITFYLFPGLALLLSGLNNIFGKK